jgi:hypothetical protein
LKEAGDWLRGNEAMLAKAGHADDLKLKMVVAMKNGGAAETARAWAEKISDPKVRETTLREIAE